MGGSIVREVAGKGDGGQDSLRVGKAGRAKSTKPKTNAEIRRENAESAGVARADMKHWQLGLKKCIAYNQQHVFVFIYMSVDR